MPLKHSNHRAGLNVSASLAGQSDSGKKMRVFIEDRVSFEASSRAIGGDKDNEN